MATNVGEIYIGLTFDTSKAESGLHSFERSVEQSTESTRGKFSAWTVALGNLASAAFQKIGQVITQNLDAAISRTDTLNSFPKIMENIGFNADDAAKAVNRLSEDLEGLPTTLDEAVSGVQRLATVYGDLDKATDTYEAMNNALLAGGASIQRQSQVMEQWNQAVARGTFDGREFKDLVEAMPGTMKRASISLLGAGASTEDLRAALSKGVLTMEDFMGEIKRLNTEGAEGFAPLTEQVGVTTQQIGTQLRNLGTQVTKVISAALTDGDINGALKKLVARFNNVIPKLVTAVIKAGAAIAQAIPEIIPPVIQAIVDAAPTLLAGITSLIDGLIQAIPQIFAMIPTLIPAITDTIISLVTVLTSPANLQLLFNGALQLLMELVHALPTMITSLVEALPTIIDNIVSFLTDPATIRELFKAAVTLFFALVQAVPEILGSLVKAFGDLVGNAWKKIQDFFGNFAHDFGEFISGIFKQAINGMLAFIENFINGPIDLLNNFIDGINNAFSFIGVNIGKIGRVQLPRLASGGIVEATQGGQVILAGEGGEDEWVVPESKMASLISTILESNEFGESKELGGITVNMNNYINNEMDAEQIGEKMMTAIRRATV